VVMLADYVEAAARSLQEPTYVKLEGLVKKITYNKLNEGELEFSDLTMSDLNKIQKSFLRVLYGIFHTRIEYPERDELEKLEDQILLKKNHGS
jgi:membrane-associated HD superfamily phosphohydrolase